MTMTTTPTAHAAPPRRWLRPAAAGAVVLVLGGAVGGWARGHGGHGSDVAPYQDPAAAGHLTLCRDGVAVTSGSVTDQPFADAVVSGRAATGGYAAAGRSATLFAYQPRAGIGAEAWSGLQLGAPSGYAEPATPTVRPTRADTTLAQFVTAFPAVDDGWVQLRLVLGAPGATADTTAYATADLHISGGTWTLAHPGDATCPGATPTP